MIYGYLLLSKQGNIIIYFHFLQIMMKLIKAEIVKYLNFTLSKYSVLIAKYNPVNI